MAKELAKQCCSWLMLRGRRGLWPNGSCFQPIGSAAVVLALLILAHPLILFFCFWPWWPILPAQQHLWKHSRRLKGLIDAWGLNSIPQHSTFVCFCFFFVFFESIFNGSAFSCPSFALNLCSSEPVLQKTPPLLP